MTSSTITLAPYTQYWYTGVCLHIYTVQFEDARAYVRGQSNWVQHIIIVIGSLLSATVQKVRGVNICDSATPNY